MDMIWTIVLTGTSLLGNKVTTNCQLLKFFKIFLQFLCYLLYLGSYPVPESMKGEYDVNPAWASKTQEDLEEESA